MSTRDRTIAKRSAHLRLRHKQSGDKSYLLWLSPTTQARLVRLKREKESLAELIDRALEALEGVANSVAEQRPDRQRVEVWIPDDLVDSLRAFLLGGVAQSVAQQRTGVANSVAEQREDVANLVAQQRVANSVAKQRLVAQAKELRKQGLSWRGIARRFNDEGTLTLSGKGQWDGKTITRMVGNE